MGEFPEWLRDMQTEREHRLALLVQLSLIASRREDIDVIAGAAGAYLRDALDCDYTKVLDARSSATGLLVRGGAGWPPGVVGEREVPEGDLSQAGYTMELGEPVIVRDMLSEERFRPPSLLLEHGVRSGISVLIEGEPEPYGVLEADSRAVAAFDEADIEIVQAFADVLAVAIARHDREMAREHFAAIAAHELRTPLTLIVGHADRLLRRLGKGAVVAEGDRDELATLNEQALRLRDSVDLFLALGDVDRVRMPLERRAIDLVDVVDSVVPAVLEQHDGARIRVEPGGDPLAVVTDASVLARILTVIIDNAVKYTAPGSTIAVSVEEDGSEAHVRVQDHCGGLSPEDLRHLFQQHYRGVHGANGDKGLGLGLYIAERLSEHLGARISVDNRDDGCCFSVSLPLPEDDADTS